MFEIPTTAAALQSEFVRLSADGRHRGLGELIDLVGACQSVINQTTALQTLAMAHLAAIEDVALEDGTVVEQHRGLGHQRLDAPALVSDQLGVSDAAASSRMGSAVEVVTRVPEVFAAMGQGRLDAYRARIVAEELRDAPPEVCAQVVARIADSLGTEPPAMLRRRVRRALEGVDADLLRAKAARARSERSLCRWPGDQPGVDTWMGSFPAEQSRSGWAVVDGLARRYVRDGRATGLEQARADALMDLIHARATGTFVVQLAVPADQLTATTQPEAMPGAAPVSTPARDADADADDTARLVAVQSAGTTGCRAPAGGRVGPVVPPTETVGGSESGDDAVVTVVGLGMPGTSQVRRAWVEGLTDTTPTVPDLPTRADAESQSRAETDFVPDADLAPDAATPMGPAASHEVVACHPATGALLWVRPEPDPPRRRHRRGRARITESKAYRPPQALIDLVKARDGRCRFPGCTVNARFCDLDHVRPWPLGPTDPTNLMCLCRRHHRIKQTARWRVRIDPDATVTWTDPTGRLRTTLPADFLQLDQGCPADRPATSLQAIRTIDASGWDIAEGPSLTDGEPTTAGCFGSMPRDTPEAMWSRWEEELAHELTRAERHRGKYLRLRHDDEQLENSVLPADLNLRGDAFAIDTAFARFCPGRGWRRFTEGEGDPPF